MRPSTDFRGRLTEKQSIRRCNACRTCEKCNTFYENASKMQWNSKLCCICYSKVKKETCVWECDACHERKPASCFDSDILLNATKLGRLRVCLACEDLGCSPRNAKKYMCSGGHECGHLKFDKQLLHNVKRDHSSTLTCQDCLAAKVTSHKCDACDKSLPDNAFDRNTLDNARKHGRRCVCLPCQELGYSPKDVEIYTCCKGHDRGHRSFDKHSLHNFKRGQTCSLTCRACREKVQHLLRLLRQKDAWRCTCKKIRRGRRHMRHCTRRSIALLAC